MRKQQKLMKIRVLVVDDHENYLQRIKPLLEKRGFTADILSNSSLILDQLCTNQYDTVVLDVGESSVGQARYALVDLVREQHPNLKIIGQTAYRDLSYVSEAKPFFDRLISKFDESELPERVREVLEV